MRALRNLSRKASRPLRRSNAASGSDVAIIRIMKD